MTRKYFTLSDVSASRFYQMPTFLFEGEFQTLSNDSRVLYALLKYRLDLSMKNKWVDKNGLVYLIFTREDMCLMLGCSQPTVRVAIKQLKEAGLMDEQRQGLTKPNLIYLCYPSEHNAYDSSQNQVEKSGLANTKESSVPERKNLSPNYIDINKTKIIEIQSIEAKPNKQTVKDEKRPFDKKGTVPVDADRYMAYRDLLKENIEYECMAQGNRCDYGELDELLDIMTDTICSDNDTIRVNRENKPADIVKSRILKLNSSHIEYVFDCLAKNTTPISNIRAYLLSALYNAPSTMNNFYRAAVNHDLYGGKNLYAPTIPRTGPGEFSQNLARYSDPRLYQLT